MKKILYPALGAVIIFISYTGFKKLEPSPSISIYGNIPPEEYLTGRFSYSENPLFIKPETLGIPVDSRSHYLRKEAAEALKQMHSAFSAENPGIKLYLSSSTRNFRDQKAIWENKWDSALFNGGGKDPLQKALKILNYSSMPGTSRHHWGTDVDINVLTNDYYETGDGKVIYTWLNTHAREYGFCQPYTKNRRKGYLEERWHWSYIPLAGKFLSGWNSNFGGDDNAFKKAGLFKGSEHAGHLAGMYVNSINDLCR